MNEYILENAALYINAYKSTFERKSRQMDHKQIARLRQLVTRQFGAVYAAILLP